MIENGSGVYICLDENGQPMTCSKVYRQIFTEKKAKSILKNIPKKLRRFNFQVVESGETDSNAENKIQTNPNREHEAPIILEKSAEDVVAKTKKTIVSSDYAPSKNITRWIEKFGSCEQVVCEAKTRLGELKVKRGIVDRKTIDILHSVELEKDLDLYHGWLLYKQLRENQRERRQIKDEILILQDVIDNVDITAMQKNKLRKQIDGLSNRKYTYRIVEDESQNNTINS